MKVYVRVWKEEGGYEELEPYFIDAYQGIRLDDKCGIATSKELPPGVVPQVMYLRAVNRLHEPEAVVMYCTRRKEAPTS